MCKSDILDTLTLSQAKRMSFIERQRKRERQTELRHKSHIDKLGEKEKERKKVRKKRPKDERKVEKYRQSKSIGR